MQMTTFGDLQKQLGTLSFTYELAGLFFADASIGVASRMFGTCSCRSSELGAVSERCDQCGRTPGSYVSLPSGENPGDYFVFQLYEPNTQKACGLIAVRNVQVKDLAGIRRGDISATSQTLLANLEGIWGLELTQFGEIISSGEVHLHDGRGQSRSATPLTLEMKQGSLKVYGIKNQEEHGQIFQEELGLFSNGFLGFICIERSHFFVEDASGSTEILTLPNLIEDYENDIGFSWLFSENAKIHEFRSRSTRISQGDKERYLQRALGYALLGAASGESECKKLLQENHPEITLAQASHILEKSAFGGAEYLGGEAVKWRCDGCHAELEGASGSLCPECKARSSKSCEVGQLLDALVESGFGFDLEGFFQSNRTEIGIYPSTRLVRCWTDHGLPRSWGNICPECNQESQIIPAALRPGLGSVISVSKAPSPALSAIVIVTEPKHLISLAGERILTSGVLPINSIEFLRNLEGLTLARYPSFAIAESLLIGPEMSYDYGEKATYVSIETTQNLTESFGIFLPLSKAQELLKSGASHYEGNLEQLSNLWQGQPAFQEPMVQIGQLLASNEVLGLVPNASRWIDTRQLALQWMKTNLPPADPKASYELLELNALTLLARSRCSSDLKLASKAKSWLVAAGLGASAEFQFPEMPTQDIRFYYEEF